VGIVSSVDRFQIQDYEWVRVCGLFGLSTAVVVART
jgi:hypothetical protein